MTVQGQLAAGGQHNICKALCDHGPDGRRIHRLCHLVSILIQIFYLQLEVLAVSGNNGRIDLDSNAGAVFLCDVCRGISGNSGGAVCSADPDPLGLRRRGSHRQHTVLDRAGSGHACGSVFNAPYDIGIRGNGPAVLIQDLRGIRHVIAAAHGDIHRTAASVSGNGNAGDHRRFLRDGEGLRHRLSVRRVGHGKAGQGLIGDLQTALLDFNTAGGSIDLPLVAQGHIARDLFAELVKVLRCQGGIGAAPYGGFLDPHSGEQNSLAVIPHQVKLRRAAYAGSVIAYPEGNTGGFLRPGRDLYRSSAVGSFYRYAAGFAEQSPHCRRGQVDLLTILIIRLGKEGRQADLLRSLDRSAGRACHLDLGKSCLLTSGDGHCFLEFLLAAVRTGHGGGEGDGLYLRGEFAQSSGAFVVGQILLLLLCQFGLSSQLREIYRNGIIRRKLHFLAILIQPNSAERHGSSSRCHLDRPYRHICQLAFLPQNCEGGLAAYLGAVLQRGDRNRLSRLGGLGYRYGDLLRCAVRRAGHVAGSAVQAPQEAGGVDIFAFSLEGQCNRCISCRHGDRAVRLTLLQHSGHGDNRRAVRQGRASVKGIGGLETAIAGHSLHIDQQGVVEGQQTAAGNGGFHRGLGGVVHLFSGDLEQRNNAVGLIHLRAILVDIVYNQLDHAVLGISCFQGNALELRGRANQIYFRITGEFAVKGGDLHTVFGNGVVGYCENTGRNIFGRGRHAGAVDGRHGPPGNGALRDRSYHTPVIVQYRSSKTVTVLTRNGNIDGSAALQTGHQDLLRRLGIYTVAVITG